MIALVVAFFSLFVFAVIAPSIRVKAKGTIYTGSVDYEADVNENFNIGVYAAGFDGDQMGEFEIKVKFDPAYIVLVTENGENNTGEVLIKGKSPDGGRVRNMLTFKAIMGGDTILEVTDGYINAPNGDKLEMNPYPEVPVHINAPELTPPGYISINGEKIKDFKSDVTQYELTLPYSENLEIKVPTDYNVICDTDKLIEGKNTVSVLVSKEGYLPIEYTIEITMESKPEEETESADLQKNDSQTSTGNKTGLDGKDQTDKSETVTEKTEEEIERELIHEALHKAEVKKKNPEIEALNLKDMKLSTNNNQEELKEQRKRSGLILIGFFGLIILIIAAKLFYSFIIENDHGILRESRIKFKGKGKNDFSFASIETKKSASEEYFKYGLDVKINDVLDNGENKGGEVDGD